MENTLDRQSRQSQRPRRTRPTRRARGARTDHPPSWDHNRPPDPNCRDRSRCEAADRGTGPTSNTPAQVGRRGHRGWVVTTLASVLMVLLLSACTPEQFRAWLQERNVDTSRMSQQDVEAGAAMATAYWQSVLSDIADLHKFDYVLSDSALARLRQCESGGNYAATSPGGTYRGAYQFAQSTWNSVASRHFPKWVGTDPAKAPSIVQDAMARALYLERGRAPWPVCGYRI